MRVVPQRRRRVAVPEALLGAQEIASPDEERGDRMPESMEADARQARLAAERREPVAHRAGGETLLVLCLPGEQPRAEWRGVRHARTPGRLALAPQRRRRLAEREPSNTSGLGGTDLFGGYAALDREDPPLQVRERERRKLAPSRTRVGCETDQQSELLGPVELACRSCRAVKRCLSLPQEALGGVEERPEVVEWHVHPRPRSRWAAHAHERVRLEQGVADCPANRGSQYPEPTRDDRHRRTVIAPPGHRRAGDRGPQRHDPHRRDRVRAQRSCVRACRRPRGGSPVVRRLDPPRHHVTDCEKRCMQCRPALGEVVSKFCAPRLSSNT